MAEIRKGNKIDSRERHLLARKTHNYAKYLSVNNPPYEKAVDKLFMYLLEQDCGKGDITSKALINNNEMAIGRVIVKDDGVISGLEEVLHILKKTRSMGFTGVKVLESVKDGITVSPGTEILRLKSEAGTLLMLERTVLNFLQRLSGIATFTSELVRHVPPEILVCPTRKTLWGIIDKKGAVAGGGGTHRLDLSDAVIVKSNHLAFGLAPSRAVQILKDIDNARFIEVEARTEMDALKWAELLASELGGRNLPPIIMFDNFSAERIHEIIEKMVKKGFYDRILFEASGGINENNVAEYANSGVDIVSIGKITHSSGALDISMSISGD